MPVAAPVGDARPVWNPDIPNPIDFRSTWLEVPTVEPEVNAFRFQWEAFLRHVVTGEAYDQTLAAGARGSLLVELALRSAAERRWVDVPPRSPQAGA